MKDDRLLAAALAAQCRTEVVERIRFANAVAELAEHAQRQFEVVGGLLRTTLPAQHEAKIAQGPRLSRAGARVRGG